MLHKQLPIKVIPNVVDSDFFSPSKHEKTTAIYVFNYCKVKF